MTNKKLVNKFAGVLVGTALSAIPLSSSAQDYSKIQKGVNAPTYVTETASHVVYHFGFNKDLQRAVKSSSNPSIYLTGDKNSYVLLDSDTTGYNLYYSKKNFNELGEGTKQVGLNVKGDEHMNPCSPKGLGSKTNYLASFFWAPSKSVPVANEVAKEVEKEKESTEQASTIYNISNVKNITNNHYSDTTNNRPERVREGLELRLLTDINKTVNTLDNPFYGVSGAIQLGKGAVWVGPYAKAGFGKETSSSSTQVYHEELLNQQIQLSTITEGMRNENSRKSYPIEFGGLLSVGSKDGRVRVNLGYGVVKEKTSTSDVIETGYDWISQNGKVVGEKKPYSIKLEEGVDADKYIPTQKIGIDAHPFRNSGFYLGAEAQHRGKVKSKMDNINYNVKAGWRFGGKRK